MRQISAGAGYARINISLDSLAHRLKQERLDAVPHPDARMSAAQAEIACTGDRRRPRGTAGRTWNLTQAGADHLRRLCQPSCSAAGPAARRTHLRLRIQMPETACEICTKRMRVLRRRADTAGSAGYLELLLNQLAQWQNRPGSPPEARSFVHYRPRRLPLLYEERGRSSAFMKRPPNTPPPQDKRTRAHPVLGFATFFTGTIHFERAHERSTHGAAQDAGRQGAATRITPSSDAPSGNFQQALECYEMLQRHLAHTSSYPARAPGGILRRLLGHFAHALGMIKSAISTAELEGTSCPPRCTRHLGVLCAYATAAR